MIAFVRLLISPPRRRRTRPIPFHALSHFQEQTFLLPSYIVPMFFKLTSRTALRAHLTIPVAILLDLLIYNTLTDQERSNYYEPMGVIKRVIRLDS